jgi:hypothetical protein
VLKESAGAIKPLLGAAPAPPPIYTKKIGGIYTSMVHEYNEKSYTPIYGYSVIIGYSFWIALGLFDEQSLVKRKIEYVPNEIWWVIFLFLPIFLLLIFPISILFSCMKKSFKAGKMFDKFSVNPHLKKFTRLTFYLDADQYSALKNYFKVMSIDLETANKFLESCKGIAFLEGFAKHPLSGGTLNFSAISKLIVETERSEQILSCAYDILREY